MPQRRIKSISAIWGVAYLAGDFPLGHVLILLHLWTGRHRRPYLSCCHPVTLHRYFAADDRDVGIRPCRKSKHRTDFNSAFWVAKRSRGGDRICHSWPPKNPIHLSVIVMLVTVTGDKIVYRLGSSKGCSRTQTSRGAHMWPTP